MRFSVISNNNFILYFVRKNLNFHKKKVMHDIKVKGTFFSSFQQLYLCSP